MFGFRFDEDGEASKFHKKVASHIRFGGKIYADSRATTLLSIVDRTYSGP